MLQSLCQWKKRAKDGVAVSGKEIRITEERERKTETQRDRRRRRERERVKRGGGRDVEEERSE